MVTYDNLWAGVTDAPGERGRSRQVVDVDFSDVYIIYLYNTFITLFYWICCEYCISATINKGMNRLFWDRSSRSKGYKRKAHSLLGFIQRQAQRLDPEMIVRSDLLLLEVKAQNIQYICSLEITWKSTLLFTGEKALSASEAFCLCTDFYSDSVKATTVISSVRERSPVYRH